MGVVLHEGIRKLFYPGVRTGYSMGYVYVVTTHDGQYSKVGQSTNPEKRLEQLQVASPHALRLEAKVETDSPNAVERAVHQELEDDGENGEWFNTDRDIVALVKEKANLPKRELPSVTSGRVNIKVAPEVHAELDADRDMSWPDYLLHLKRMADVADDGDVAAALSTIEERTGRIESQLDELSQR